MKAPAVTPAAAMVSDQTSLAVVGLDARQFRRFLVEQHIPHAVVHRHVVARIDLVLAALDRLAGIADSKPASGLTEAEVVQLAARRRR